MASRIRALWGSTATQTVFGVIDQALVSGTNFVTAIVLGRAAGLDELGAYSLGFPMLIVVATVHEALVAIPYSVYGNRLEGDERRTLAGSSLVHAGMVAAVASVWLLLVAGVLSTTDANRSVLAAIWVLVIAAPLSILREFVRRFSFAELRVRTAVAVDAFVTVLHLGGLAVLIAVDEVRASTVLGVAGAAAGIPAAIWLIRERDRFLVRPHEVRRSMRAHWLFGRWVGAARLTSIAHSYVVPWILAVLVGIGATGGYSAASSIIAVSNPLLIGVGMVLTPRSARAFAEGGIAELSRVVRKAATGVTAATVVLAIPLMITGPSLLRLVFGEDAGEFGATVRVLVLALVVSAIGMGPESGLRALERPQISLLSSASGLIVTVTITLATVSSLGAVGGAWGIFGGGAVSTAVKCGGFLKAERERNAGSTEGGATDPAGLPSSS